VQFYVALDTQQISSEMSLSIQLIALLVIVSGR